MILREDIALRAVPFKSVGGSKEIFLKGGGGEGLILIYPPVPARERFLHPSSYGGLSDLGSNDEELFNASQLLSLLNEPLKGMDWAMEPVIRRDILAGPT